MLVWRSHAERGISFADRVLIDIAIVLLFRVRIRIHYRVFIKHLPVRMISCKDLEVCNLILNFWLYFTQSLWKFHAWQGTLFTIIIGEASVSFVFWNNGFSGTLCAHYSTLDSFWAFVSVHLSIWNWCRGRRLVLSLLLSSMTTFLSCTLSRVLVISVLLMDLQRYWHVIHLFMPLLAR